MISVVLFEAAVNMLLKAAVSRCGGPQDSTGQRHPPCHAFMDDITAMTQHAQPKRRTRWLPKGLESMANWARLAFKPKKSRSLMIKRGKLEDYIFHIQGEAIPTTEHQPIKCFCKKCDDTLRDINNAVDVTNELKRCLSRL